MEPHADCPPSFYAQLLGPRWTDLDPAVRGLHETGAGLHAAGTFRIRRGNTRLARLLAAIARMPQAGDAVEMRLVVTPRGQGEEWRRSFAGRPLISVQTKHADGLLVECMGPLEMRFGLDVAGGALGYQTQRVALRLGALRLPLPRWFAPRVTAWEKPTGDPDRTQISVESRLRLLGLLISYEGLVIRSAARQFSAR
jgi:hypothetical protein